ncbi:MAG: MDR family oxidoreductase [Deferrisomatales bacterium]
MGGDSFRAVLLTQEQGHMACGFQTLTEDDLPEGDVLVEVEYSSLNFKDALAVTGRGKIVRRFPMVPGIDLAGTVLRSDAPDYRPGDRVLLTGWGIGEAHWGGYSQRQRVRSEWLVPMPEGLDTRRAMALGTAGFTAMLCVLALEEGGVEPGARLPVLVTGSCGGVGSVATAVLARLGYAVAGVVQSPDQEAYLRRLGARHFVSREERNRPPRPLETQRWSGAVDTVGTTVLARVLAETAYGGCVACCGLAGGADLPANVMPFILRAIRLQGVESVTCPAPRRRAAWQRLVEALPSEVVDGIHRVEPLSRISELADEILAGRLRGRVVLDVNR